MLECLAVEVAALDPRSRASQQAELCKFASQLLGTLVNVLDTAGGTSGVGRLAAKGIAAWLQLSSDAASASLLSIGVHLPHSICRIPQHA